MRNSGFDFSNVSWMALTPDERQIYVVQRGAPAVSIWTLDGRHIRSWDEDKLGEPHSLTFQVLSDGRTVVWITDMAPPITTGGTSYGHCIKKFTPEGSYLGSIGTCGENSEGTGIDPVQFDKVTDVAFQGDNKMWVTDGDLDGLNNRVLSIDIVNGKVETVWSAPDDKPGSGEKEFNLPHAIDVDSCDRVFVADALNHRVQIIKTDGTFLQQLRCFGQNGVYGLTVEDSKLYVSSSGTNFDGKGKISIYGVSASCTQPLPVERGCEALYEWPMALPEGTGSEALHAIDAERTGAFVLISPLGGDVLPQRWNKVYLPK